MLIFTRFRLTTVLRDVRPLRVLTADGRTVLLRLSVVDTTDEPWLWLGSYEEIFETSGEPVLPRLVVSATEE